MREAAADGIVVPHLVMRHMPDRRHEQRMRRAQPRLVLDVASTAPRRQSKSDRDLRCCVD
jgi:hypothetical protein